MLLRRSVVLLRCSVVLLRCFVTVLPLRNSVVLLRCSVVLLRCSVVLLRFFVTVFPLRCFVVLSPIGLEFVLVIQAFPAPRHVDFNPAPKISERVVEVEAGILERVPREP